MQCIVNVSTHVDVLLNDDLLFVEGKGLNSIPKRDKFDISTKEAIAAMIKSHDKVIKLHFPVVQQHPDTSSCGLFALANAYTLCEGKDPVSINYDVNNMRFHFLTSIFNNYQIHSQYLVDKTLWIHRPNETCQHLISAQNWLLLSLN